NKDKPLNFSSNKKRKETLGPGEACDQCRKAHSRCDGLTPCERCCNENLAGECKYTLKEKKASFKEKKASLKSAAIVGIDQGCVVQPLNQCLNESEVITTLNLNESNNVSFSYQFAPLMERSQELNDFKLHSASSTSLPPIIHTKDFYPKERKRKRKRRAQ